MKSRIVLGHSVSDRDIEVNKAKVELIAKLSPPSTVRKMRSFLGHAGFYHHFIKDFSKISKPLCDFLAEDVPFEFTHSCLEAFERLKTELTSAPIIRPPDWNLSFEVMYSDYTVVVVLGQRVDKLPHVICYAAKLLTMPNWTTLPLKKVVGSCFRF